MYRHEVKRRDVLFASMSDEVRPNILFIVY